MNAFFLDTQTPWEDVGGGIKRKIIGYTDEIMAVHVCFAKGAVGAVHYHEEHDQIAFVGAGSFEVTVGDEVKVLKAGDAYTAAKYVKHGAVSLEDDSVLIDMFSPLRAEFLQ
ncbi:MAG TPA: pectin degradation protein [Oceanospirillaceae bacterium]|nr:pectin degradation protein [Oceanospirillaceae bacterium]